MFNLRLCAAALAVCGSSYAFADFAGQPILGPLVPGSVVTGDTTGHADDNDGFESGIHIFDIWRGPDDVWQLNWPGGDMRVEMTYNNTTGDDLDLFLYEPGSYDSSANYSIINTGLEVITAADAVAGIYYLNVDSENAATAGPYTITVFEIPEPASLGMLAAGSLVLRRRR